jgi:hypothetical protein
MKRKWKGGGGNVYFVDSRAIFVGNDDDLRCSRVTKLKRSERLGSMR